ncbi:MAG TPA: ATP-binding protein [Verrucomicrobiae bacterium]|jgi:signal transduction histidine kinase|nr:ATP-binding protein [Verrucomicrobiae bacterium]
MELAPNLERIPRTTAALASLGMVALVGVIDYQSDAEILFSVFYLLAVALATWRVGAGYGMLISCLSVAAWIGGDLLAGVRYRNTFVPLWNAGILLLFYFTVVGLLASLHALQNNLSAKVRDRTLALTQEMAERERLEKEILEISERERRRIGDDIHDTLCQHLTATALAGQVLRETLTLKAAPEAADARRIVGLIEGGISMARDLARGVQPVQVDAEGLMEAFRALAATTSETAKIECSFDCAAPILVENATTATNLYRIGHEAVTNAVRHGKPQHICITLARRPPQLVLTVEDDGSGLPERWDQGNGLGARIMAHRALMIGAKLDVEPNPTGGTMVTCCLPMSS